MSLKDKFSKINVNKLVADGEARRSAGQTVESQKTALGFHVDAIHRDKEIAEENERLQHELKAFKGANVTKRLDPNAIKASHWANRDEASFHSKEFEKLKEEIESAGGNVQPIKVRPLRDEQGEVVKAEYEIVFGHRRHRACLELGIDVLAIIEELDDSELFKQMDRENRERANLRPYEKGVMYARALDKGLFVSQRKLEEELGLSNGETGKLIAIARLPEDVLNAFISRLEIQYDWGVHINTALQKDPDIVLSRAKELAKLDPKKAAKEVFSTLTSAGVESLYTPSTIEGRRGSKAKISFDAKKKSIGIQIAGVDPNRLSELEQLVKKFLEK